MNSLRFHGKCMMQFSASTKYNALVLQNVFLKRKKVKFFFQQDDVVNDEIR
jgi:hypothetical protein